MGVREERGSLESGSPQRRGLAGGERRLDVRHKVRGAGSGVIEHCGVMQELGEVTAWWFCGRRWLSPMRSSRRWKAGGTTLSLFYDFHIILLSHLLNINHKCIRFCYFSLLLKLL
jgi:hypothetical protein